MTARLRLLLLIVFLLPLVACSCGKEKRCDGDSECKRGSCQNSVCVEDGVGAACEVPGDCRGTLACNRSLPDGYCTKECASSGECPSGTACLVRGGLGLCWDACQDDDDCRSDYVCSGGVCDLPCGEDAECGGGEVCSSGRCESSGIGESCAAAADCRDGLDCIGGACTAACTVSADCPPGGACGVVLGDRRCVPACRAELDCGPNGLCLSGGCLPRCTDDADCGGAACDVTTGRCSNATGLEIEEIPLGAVTPSSPTPFVVPEGTFAMTIQVQGAPGVEYSFTSVRTPANTELVRVSGGGLSEPLRTLPQTEVITAQIPNSDSAQLTPEPGTWTFNYTGGNAEAKVILKRSVDGNSRGGDVYLNVHIAPNAFSGGVTAASAPSDTFVQETLDSWQRLYGEQASVGVADIRYIDIGAEWTDVQASLTGADGELNDMWRLGAADGLNVFFVRSIGGGFGGIAGISGGIPGPPLTGGTGHSGIAIEVQDTSLLTGIDLCHEAGHFQGLFHTSEFFGQGHDLLSDTPECDPPTGGCDQAVRHVMFPALDPRQSVFSGASALVLQANAGVR